MRKRILAAVAVTALAAFSLPAAASADWAGPTGPAALTAPPALPAGSLWGVGGAPACQTVATTPQAPAGETVILVGQPGRRVEWCGAYARIGAGGSLSLPGGVPGEWLSVEQYARQTGQSVTVAYQPTGSVVVYLS
jgi:hypothetical protein